MKWHLAARDGALMALAIMACRVSLVLAFDWPHYSLPEFGCLYVAAEILNLGESKLIHIAAPSIAAMLCGGILGIGLANLPKLNQLRPRSFRILLGILVFVTLASAILLFPLREI
jgi:hypothetical protein